MISILCRAPQGMTEAGAVGGTLSSKVAPGAERGTSSTGTETEAPFLSFTKT